MTILETLSTYYLTHVHADPYGFVYSSEYDFDTKTRISQIIAELKMDSFIKDLDKRIELRRCLDELSKTFPPIVLTDKNLEWIPLTNKQEDLYINFDGHRMMCDAMCMNSVIVPLTA